MVICCPKRPKSKCSQRPIFIETMPGRHNETCRKREPRHRNICQSYQRLRSDEPEQLFSQTETPTIKIEF